MSRTLKEIYVQNENSAIENIREAIVENLKAEGTIHQVQKSGRKKEDVFFELDRVVSDDAIYFKKRNNKPKEWIVPFDTLNDAIKFTIRKGRVARATEYMKMNGTSNFIGTPLHTLISTINTDEYLRNSIVGKNIPHKVFGDVFVETIEYENDVVTAKVNEKEKTIVLDYWQMDDVPEELFRPPVVEEETSEE